MAEAHVECLSIKKMFKCPHCKKWMSGANVTRIRYSGLEHTHSNLLICRLCGKKERACDWIEDDKYDRYILKKIYHEFKL